jgi:hypothetical protein
MSAPLSALRVPGKHKVNALVHYAGRQFLVLEGLIWQALRECAPSSPLPDDWAMWEVSNGAFYLAPSGRDRTIWIDTGGYTGNLSLDAAGIVASLLGLRQMVRLTRSPAFMRQHDLLLEWVKCRVDCDQILASAGHISQINRHKKPRIKRGRGGTMIKRSGLLDGPWSGSAGKVGLEPSSG